MESSRDDFVIAIRSAFLKKETKQRFSLLGLILFSVLILILGQLNFKVINYIKIGIKEIVYRSSYIVSAPENAVKKNYSTIQSHFKLYIENKKNKTELEYLKSKDLSNQIRILENNKYKKIIDDYFIETNEIYAKVLIDKESPFLRSVVLNKGSRNNIKLGMVVLDGTYLVGKIVEVNYLSARVLLISDINSKIPVSLEPGDVQAIMSGKGKETGVLQYTKTDYFKNTNKDLLVFTSGAGGIFKSGIPIGVIKKENIPQDKEKIVNFYKDFSQLKYVKVVSFSKEKIVVDQISKEGVDKIDNKIKTLNQQKEAMRILLEQKKIEQEIRVKIEEENIFLKNKIIQLQNKISIAKKTIKQNKIQNDEIKFLKLNSIYGKKCKKNFFNNLYKVGSEEYKACVINKGPKKN
tara:strand:- start:4018 stop:5238 length:1221 start_codon:yes stop_codon:yes gene_type:complete